MFKKSYKRCICHDPIMVSLKPGQKYEINCPRHGVVVVAVGKEAGRLEYKI